MKQTFLLACALLLSSFAGSAQSLNWEWVTPAGSANTGNAITGICRTSDGNLAVAGTFGNSYSIGSTSVTGAGRHVYLAKSTPSGAVLFLKSVISGPASPITIAGDGSGNVYVVGNFEDSVLFDTTQLRSRGATDLFVACFNAAGDFRWVRQIGGAYEDDFYSSGATCVSGHPGVVVSGTVVGAVLVAGEPRQALGPDIVLARFDASGNLVWDKILGGSGSDNGRGICADEQGNLYATGGIEGTQNFDGIPISNAYYGPFVAKYSIDGTLRWLARGIGGMTSGDRIVVDKEGSTYLTGSTGSGPMAFGSTTLSMPDYFIAKADSTGAWQWAKGGMGMRDRDLVQGSAIDGLGNLVLGGCFQDSIYLNGTTILRSQGPSVFGGFVMKLTPAGTVESTVQSSGAYVVSGLVTDEASSVYCVGTAGMGEQLGAVSLSYPKNMFLAKLSEALSLPSPSPDARASLRVVPNPNRGSFAVLLEPQAGSRQARVVDAAGRVVYRAAIDPGASRLAVQLPNVPAGSYYLLLDNRRTGATVTVTR